MDISTQTFRESYTDYYNQKILANENADENDWRSMSDKQWDKMLDGIDDYVDDFKENLKRLKEMQDKAADRAVAGARSDMRANAAANIPYLSSRTSHVFPGETAVVWRSLRI